MKKFALILDNKAHWVFECMDGGFKKYVPVYEKRTVQKLDTNGAPMFEEKQMPRLDKNGRAVIRQLGIPTFDENGNLLRDKKTRKAILSGVGEPVIDKKSVPVLEEKDTAKVFQNQEDNTDHWFFVMKDGVKSVYSPEIVFIDITAIVPEPKQNWDYIDGKFSTPDINVTLESLIRMVSERIKYLLRQSDHTQIEDSDLTAEQKQQWKNYRQQLRELPKALKPGMTLEDVIFPTMPEEV